MKTSVRRIGDVSVVDLDGRITIGEGDIVLRERIGELLEQGRRCILLNLEGISYMDSCGLAELVSCQRRARENRAEMKLLSPSAKVHALLQVTNLDQIFETFRDEEKALASFCADSGSPRSRYSKGGYVPERRP